MGKAKTEPKAARPNGRPSTFTQAIADEICDRMANGETLRQICLLEHIPDKKTVMRWLAVNEKFRHQYTRARQDLVEHFAEELRDIANDGRNDWEEVENERTGASFTRLNGEAVARSRLRVDTLKWLMSKIAPKKYGEKIELEQTGKQTVRVIIGGDRDGA